MPVESADRVFRIVVPVVLLVMLGGAMACFWMLIRHWTIHRQWMNLQEWAAGNGYKLCNPQRLPAVSALTLLGENAKVLIELTEPKTTVVQVEAPPPVGGPVGRTVRWHLLIRRMESSWRTAALRPVSRPTTIVDYLPLESMYGTLPGERFAAYGQERGGAVSLGDSIVRGLLPPDIALLLTGEELILDYSTRPFDTLTIQRMDALAKQLVVHLPKREPQAEG